MDTNQFSSISTTSAPPQVDEFEAAAAEFAADPDLSGGQPGFQGATMGAEGASSAPGSPWRDITPEAAQRWLEVVPNAVSRLLHNKDYELQDYERDLMADPLRALMNKHAPELLKKSDSPEVTLLLIGVLAYAARVGASWKGKGEQKTEGQGQPAIIPPDKTREQGAPPQQSSPLIVASVGGMAGRQAPLP
jgi:hypothetical protein